MKTEKFGPLIDGHPYVDDKCPACSCAFKIGDFIARVPIGPGAYTNEMAKCRNNLTYNPIKICCHYSCITGERRVKERRSSGRRSSDS